MKKNCLTDFYSSDISAFRGIAFLLFEADLILKTKLKVNKPG
jgi:hypothetical protein